MEQSIQTDRVADYLAELRPHLDDLDPNERAEVLDELADALREVAAEDDRPLREVLGSPAYYVAAYRASAGLERQQPQRSGRLRTLPENMRNTVRTHPWWPHVLALARLLRPAWWTLRGAVLAVLLGGALGIFRLSQVMSLLGLVCITGAVAASVAIGGGRQLTRGWRRVLAGANVIAVFAALTTASELSAVRDEGWGAGYDAAVRDELNVSSFGAGQLMLPDGELVTNIYPYTRDGEPLRDVLLFDGAGQPLTLVPDSADVLSPGEDIETRYERDADGQAITNLYPLQQYIVEYDDKGLPSRRPRTAPTIVLPPAVRDDATESPTAQTSEQASSGGAASDE
jgi:hypothetical protein